MTATTKPRKVSAREMSERAMAFQIEDNHLPAPVAQYRFHPTRRWAFDFAWPEQHLALEVQGWGRHQTFMGYENDCVRAGEALALGWRILNVTVRMVNDGRAIDLLKRALEVT